MGTTFTITYNNGRPTISPSVVQLTQGTDATVQLDDTFPAGSSIDTVTIFHDQAKQDQVCQWNRSGGGEACNFFSFTSGSDTVVDIWDDETTTSEDDFWFSVAGTASGASWSIDPEIENEPTG